MSERGAQSRISILLVEDNADHAELMLKALENGHLTNRVHWVKDGEEALDFLHRRGRFTDPAAAFRPGLVLLDLKLPRMDGQEVLRQIKSDQALRSIPVVMLTTSAEDEDAAASYRAGANSFLTKPGAFAEIAALVMNVMLYWVLTARLPEG